MKCPPAGESPATSTVAMRTGEVETVLQLRVVPIAWRVLTRPERGSASDSGIFEISVRALLISDRRQIAIERDEIPLAGVKQSGLHASRDLSVSLVGVIGSLPDKEHDYGPYRR